MTELNMAYVGLGANLNQPTQQLITALNTLSQLPNSRLTHHSSLYQSTALKPPISTVPTDNTYCQASQPDYINACACIKTSLSAIELLDQLQAIERTQGRIQTTIKWSSRSLDLDLLLFNTDTYASTRLTLPHPELHKRSFVLVPLLEITPDLCLPNGKRLKLLYQALLDCGQAQPLTCLGHIHLP